VSRPPGRKSRRTGSILSSKHIAEAVESQKEILCRGGIEPSVALLEGISAYIELLLRWNRKINLTAIAGPQEIVARNFAESFLAAPWLDSAAGVLCDVGSGAGFPGLPLKLILPGWSVILMDSSAKKTGFLAEASRALHLTQVRVECARWQESQVPPSSLDAVTARALGDYAALASWARTRLKPHGKLLLWIVSEEAGRLRSLPGWNWKIEPVPDSREQVLLIGTPR
jgi:16S rRNA (guanine527-N7)-methyltransferase